MLERSLLKAVSSVLPSREPGGSSESRDSQTTVKSLYNLQVVEMLLPEARQARNRNLCRYQTQSDQAALLNC